MRTKIWKQPELIVNIGRTLCDFRHHFVKPYNICELPASEPRRICGACVGDWACDLYMEKSEALAEKMWMRQGEMGDNVLDY